MSDIIAELSWRGLIHQSTAPEQLQSWLNVQPRTLYAGFDPTATSLHVGSLMPLLLLRRFQKAGHRPIALVGGATGMIGDPTGKSAERNLLTKEQLAENVAGIEQQMRRFLDFEGPHAAILLNNFDWMSGFSYLDFLRDVGKHFPVNVMLDKDSVKNRIESEAGISYTEFSYMLLQAYDFAYLQQWQGCELQVGGSDQWGNITAGIDLARRMRGVQLYGLTCPLLLTSDGKKMGKTEQGAIWLDAARTSPYAFYQYWVNIADADAGMSLRFLTELSQDEVLALDNARTAEPHKRESQKRLAEELTRLVHGEEGLAAARNATAVLHEGAKISEFNDAQLNEIFADVPSKDLSRSQLESGKITLLSALVEAGLSKSNSEARRTIEQGGAYINNIVRTGHDTVLGPQDLASETVMVVRQGKKKYGLLRFTS